MALFLLLTILSGIGLTFYRKKANKYVVPALSTNLSFSQNSIKNIEEEVVKRILFTGFPLLETTGYERKTLFSFPDLLSSFSQSLTNVDIFNPETYFSLNLPLLNLMKTQAALTPGVEFFPTEPPIVENEHDLKDPQPQPSEEELDNTKVEKITSMPGKPLVLIYHTHTTESYTPSPAFNYTPSSTYHTENLNLSVAKVGEVMTQELNNLNIPTIHNTTVHDIPTYMTSYANSLKTCEEVLKQNPSIEIVIDLHRDAPTKDPQSSRDITTVKIDNKTLARFMLVVGTDKNFPHPHWKENYQFSTLLHENLEKTYPGISRGLLLREERFNQHVSKKAILVEVGSHGNTMEEAIESARVFAKVLADLIKNLSAE